jgi:hypothetical protein
VAPGRRHPARRPAADRGHRPRGRRTTPTVIAALTSQLRHGA